MKTVIIPEQQIDVFEYAELSEPAKMKAKEEYLDNDTERVWRLEEYFNEELLNMFPKSDLRIQFSLSSCQGDGVNIYGSLNLFDARDFIFAQAYQYDCEFSDEDKKKISELSAAIFGNGGMYSCVNLKQNPRYGYCYIRYSNITGQLYDILDGLEIKYNTEDTAIFVGAIQDVLSEVCRKFEKEGYEYLYYVSDDEIDSVSSANEWLYYRYGRRFNEQKIMASVVNFSVVD